MTFTTPLVATWLLERWSVDEALIGDLVEQYQRKRSAAWYWREVLVALFVSGCRTIASHKWLAVRAILTGWLVWFLWSLTFGRALDRSLEQLALASGAGTSSGWSAYGYLAIRILKYAGWIANGWIIGRFHRPYQTAMVLVYIAFSLVMCVPSLIAFLADALGHPRYHPTPSGIALTVLCLFIGGMLSTHPRHRAVRRTA